MNPNRSAAALARWARAPLTVRRENTEAARAARHARDAERTPEQRETARAAQALKAAMTRTYGG